jgi:NAD-dependent dihydropyrimidine dehydrogenase PreA subunit
MAHHKLKNGELVEAGPIQTMLQSLFIRNTSIIFRLFDKFLRIRFLNEGGKPILKAMARMLSFLPTAEVVSLDRAKEFINAISILDNTEIALGPCACQRALGQRNGTYIKDLMVLYGAEAARNASSEFQEITPDEAKKLLQQLHDEGLIQAFLACMRSKGWVFLICSCDREICIPFRAHQLVGGEVFPGLDIVYLDSEKCTGCGVCVERCHFGANSLNGAGTCEVDLTKCYGCGLCVSTCSGSARRLVKREDYRSRYYPFELVNKVCAH